MLILTGDVGKSYICQLLSNHFEHKSIFIYNEENIPTIEGIYISPKECNLEELCEFISKEISNQKGVSLLIVYTNLEKDKILPIKQMLEELEKQNSFVYGIIMCRENKKAINTQSTQETIKAKPMISWDEKVKENWFSCGVCANSFGWKRAIKTMEYNYCPSCGTKIDWGKEE